MARSRSNSQDKQAEIFSAAVRIFRKKGYHAASMQDLADAVGLNKASLYYYVSSKEDLLISICERFTGAFTRQLTDLVATPISPSEKLARAIEDHVVALCEQLELFTVYLHDQRFLKSKLRARLRAEGERHAELLEDILEEGIRCGEFRRLDATITAHAIIGMCNWLYQWYSPQGRLSPKEIADIFSGLVIDGCKSSRDNGKRKRSTAPVFELNRSLA